MGLAFKPNCKDTRNSGVFELIKNLNNINIIPDVFDPLTSIKTKSNLKYNYLKKLKIKKYKNIIIAVAHNQIKKMGLKKIRKISSNPNVHILDITSQFQKRDLFFQL